MASQVKRVFTHWGLIEEPGVVLPSGADTWPTSSYHGAAAWGYINKRYQGVFLSIYDIKKMFFETNCAKCWGTYSPWFPGNLQKYLAKLDLWKETDLMQSSAHITIYWQGVSHIVAFSHVRLQYDHNFQIEVILLNKMTWKIAWNVGQSQE